MISESFAAIELESISTLEAIELPNLRTAYSPSAFNIEVYDCPKVRVTAKYCSDIRSILGDMVSIGQMNCGELVSLFRLVYQWSFHSEHIYPN